MVSTFTVFAPPLMGYGASATIGEQCKQRGVKKAILVYDKGIEQLGLADKIKQHLKDAGIEYVHFDGVEPDPTDISIEAGAKIARDAGNVQCVIGIGGGSSLDTAKGINVLMGNPSPLSTYYLGGQPTKPGLPLFLLPTTAGTGSECTMSCIVTDTVNHRKTTIRSLNCNVATLAIVDPELTMGMPPKLTAMTGIDAFTHAAESLTVNKPNPMSDTLDKESMRRIAKYLPLAVKDGQNKEARENVAIAAMMSGMAFANTLCHLGHSFGHAIGAKTHAPHGYCVGASIAQAIYLVAPTLPERVRIIGECMGQSFSGNESPEEIGRKTAEAIFQLKKDINLPTLQDLGVKREDVIAAYPLVPKDGCYPFSVRTLTEDEVKEWLGKIYDNTI